MKRLPVVLLILMAALSACAIKPTEEPYFKVDCVERPANGPADVPLKHAVVTINGEAYPDLWIEIVAMSSSGDQSFLVSYFGGETYYSDVFDGYLSSMRQEGHHVFSSEASYLVQGWRHPYTEDVPTFKNEELVFKTGFDIPICR